MEALEVDNSTEYDNGYNEVYDVQKTVMPESLVEGMSHIFLCEEKMKECNKGTLELGAISSVDNSGGECLLDNRLVDICCNKQGNAGTKTIALLEFGRAH